MTPFVLSSFGDIVAAAQLALAIYQSLSDSRGAPFELNCLVDELRSFSEALLSLSKIICEIEIPLTEPVTMNIKDEAAACINFLENFRDAIKPYETAFAGGQGSFKKVWRKICWGVFKPKEISKLREKLSQRKQNISLWLGLLEM
jgi:hypothetical protein